MTRTILVAVILLLVAMPCCASQKALTVGASLSGVATNGTVTSTSTGIDLGTLIYTENWLFNMGTQFPLATGDPLEPSPSHGAFGVGYMFGRNALLPRPFIMAGADAIVLDDMIHGGPKLSAGLSKPIEDATLLTVGPYVSYIPATKQMFYGIVAQLYVKLGASTALPTRAGAGGQTPRGLFPAN
jgi:hypothetical protein